MTRKIIFLVIATLFSVMLTETPLLCQMGRYETLELNSRGQILAGVNVAVCTTLATTAASVTNNIATLTMASNPQTAGFLVGFSLTVSGFTGGDTYFNTTATIVAVSSTTISFTLVHANASATSNGIVYMTGSTTQACAPLASLFTDNTGSFSSPNPFVSDGLGNVGLWAAAGPYYIQTYGPTVTTSVKLIGIGCVPSSSTATCGVYLNGNNAWTGVNNFKNLEQRVYADQYSGSDPCAQIAAAEAALPSTGGIVDASAFQGTLTACASTLTVNKPIQLMLGAATYTLNGNPGIAVTSISAPWIIGINQGGVVNSNVNGASNLVYAGASGGDVILWGDQSNTILGGGVRDLSIDMGALAFHALHVRDAETWKYDHLYIHNPNTSASTEAITFDNDHATTGGTGHGTVSDTDLDMAAGGSGSASCLGVRGSGSTGVFDILYNRVTCLHFNGNGFNDIFGDANVLIDFQAFRSGGGTGKAVNINPVNAGDPVDSNVFITPTLSPGGFFIQTQSGGALVSSNYQNVIGYANSSQNIAISGAGAGQVLVIGNYVLGAENLQSQTGTDYSNATTSLTIFKTFDGLYGGGKYSFSCDLTWQASANTVTLQLAVVPNLAPTLAGVTYQIYTNSSGANTSGNSESTSTGGANSFTGGTAAVGSTPYIARIWGTIESNAAANVFSIEAAAPAGGTVSILRDASFCRIQ